MNEEDPGANNEKQTSSNLFDGRDFFPAGGLRCLIQDSAGLTRLLLAYNFRFLPALSILLWLVFLVVKTC
jgi:hypothetical protein